MDGPTDAWTLPALPSSAAPDAGLPLRLQAIAGLVEFIERYLAASAFDGLTGSEDLSLQHLAKGAGTARSALRLIEAGCWADACILARAVFEQLFAYLWVVQDPHKAETRRLMVTLKQEWANAKYLEGLLPKADPRAIAELQAEAGAYRREAEGLMARLAAELGLTEKQVRDEATRRVSAKAVEVNLGPAFVLPYAHYSGFVHSDGHALAAYVSTAPDGRRVYGSAGLPALALPLARDLHRVLWRLASEVRVRCARLPWPGAGACFAAHAAWLESADGPGRPGPAGDQGPS